MFQWLSIIHEIGSLWENNYLQAALESPLLLGLILTISYNGKCQILVLIVLIISKSRFTVSKYKINLILLLFYFSILLSYINNLTPIIEWLIQKKSHPQLHSPGIEPTDYINRQEICYSVTFEVDLWDSTNTTSFTRL